MHPLLFHIGPVAVHTYGFLMAVGFIVGVLVAKALARQSGLDAVKVAYLAIWSFVVGFLGTRLLFIILHIDDYISDPVAALRIWDGGIVFLGGPPAVVLFLIWYTRRHRLPVWQVMDCFVPGLVIGHMFGRLGCFMAGCCYGKSTGSEIGIRLYSQLVDPLLRGVPLHPVQLYSAVALFMLFWVLIQIFRHKRFHGQVVLTYFTAYPVLRCFLELFRGDEVRGFVIPGVLSTSQFVSILIFLTAATVLAVRLRQVRGAPDMTGKKSKPARRDIISTKKIISPSGRFT